MKRKPDLYDLLIVNCVAIIIYFVVHSYLGSIPKPVFRIEQNEKTNNIDTFSEANLNHLMYILDIKHPEIVIKQARLETGYYTASRFIKHNALFGFQTSEINVIKYKNWKESVIAYKVWQMKRLKDNENYYIFLKRVKYASDSNYIKKLKAMRDV